MTRAEKALLSAASHVYRQQFAGKHEQDRTDAVEWLKENKAILQAIRRRRRSEYQAESRQLSIGFSDEP